MKNIRIVVSHPDHENSSILVKADSERFGIDAIMFEGISFDECLDYVRRETGRNHFQLQAFSMMATYTDYKGKTLPWIMNVIN